MQSSGGYGGYYDSPQDASRDEELRGSVDTEYGERTGASTGSPGRSMETAPTGGGNLDVPIGDREPQARPPREEPSASTADPLDADAATREGGGRREEIEVQEDRSPRVYKRAARPAR
jgi:hypothetical protein